MTRFALLFVCAALARAASASSECGSCHRAEARVQPTTAMAHALESARDCDILKAHPRLLFQNDRYTYTIRREGDTSIYAVTDGHDTITAPIAWAFGLGAAGQTYVFERDGIMYESRVSFYKDVNGLDLTMGAGPAQTLADAAGRRMDSGDVRDCFGCHSTGGVRGGKFHPESMRAGVQCERCHGEATQHVAAKAPMKSLTALTTEEQSSLCGGCHRTWEQITTGGPHGILNVRFQPYRLTNSKCYDAADKRIACTACHNPHAPSATNAAFYDAKCGACHSTTNKGARLCPVARQNCVTCHMPKVELPGAHHQFTDHQIRIARAGEKYPD